MNHMSQTGRQMSDSAKVPSTNPEHTARRDGGGRRVACRDCRQAKLRCDKTAESTESCARCRRLGLACRVDTEYKRYNKKAKLNDLAEQVERLQSVVNTQASMRQPSNFDPVTHPHDQLTPGSDTQYTQGRPHSVTSAQNLGGDRPFAQNSRPSHQSQYQPQTQPRAPPSGGYVSAPLESSTLSEDRSIGDIRLTKQQSWELFQTFFDQCHHFLDILDSSMNADQCYAASPLLFWAIISVASRNYKPDPSLFASLSTPVQDMLWAAIPALPHAHSTIQAIIIISMWPFPIATMSKDCSFLLVSLAKTAAMQIGLHRPEVVQDFLRVRTRFNPQEFQMAVKIWAGCFIASQCVSSSIGQPSVLPSDWAIDSACEVGNKYTVHDNLRHHLLIYKFMAKVNSVLADSDRPTSESSPDNERIMLISVLERDFADLERQIRHKISVSQQILLDMVSLQLGTFYFFMKEHTEVRKLGLLKAYTTAVSVISKSVEADKSWGFLKNVPNGYLQILYTGAILVMKIVHSSYSQYIDVDEGKRAFDSIAALKLTALDRDYYRDDLRDRIRRILEQLWSLHHSLTLAREQEPGLRVKSRLGASVMHDALWTFRDQHAISVSDLVRQEPTLAESSNSWTTQPEPVSQDQTLLAAGTGQNNPLTPLPPFFENWDSEDLLNTDWIWDVGFPSLLPVDLDSYTPPNALS